jgi:hypothetical protein
MKKEFFFLSILFTLKLQGQTAEKWAANVNWDGVSPWQKYIIYSPLFMGPSALPVPLTGNGSIDSLNSFSMYGAVHVSKGDITNNLRLSANYCLVKNLISFDLTWIPVEYYQMSHALKTERRVYYEFYDDKKAAGDICLNTNFQLFNSKLKNSRVALRIGYRFPSSSGVGAARYTDAPGYYFDVSAARFLTKHKKWVIISMLGFYVWQLNTYGQNDAFLFGAGVEYTSAKWRWKFNSSGYTGWIGNGDSPVKVNTSLERKCKHFSLVLNIGHGLKDYIYSSAEAGIRFDLTTLRKGR